MILRRDPPFSAQLNVFQRQLQDFVTASRERVAPMVTGEQGLQSLRLIEALYACRRPIGGIWDAVPGLSEQRA